MTQLNLVGRIFRTTDSGDVKKSTQKLTLDCESTVLQLKQKISDDLVERSDRLSVDVFYCGQMLEENYSLSQSGLRDGSCFSVMVKEEVNERQERNVTAAEVSQCLTKLMDPKYQNTVDSVLSSSEIINDIIAESPELQKDLVAQIILKDLHLINVLADSDNVESILKAHPCLAAATVKVCDFVMDHVAKHGIAQTSRAGSYALDHMSDEEDDNTPRRAAVPFRSPARPQGPTSTSHITPELLAQAIAMATGNPSNTGSSQQPSISSPSQPQAAAAPQSSSDRRAHLSNALTQALGSFSSSPSTSTPHLERPPDTTADYSSQLQQLRDMGINDERVALQALQAAGGDVHLALNIIYGDM